MKRTIGILIFLLLLIASFFALGPVYSMMNKGVRYLEDRLTNLVDEKTGLGLSYDKLSPSIFSGVHINGVTLFDRESGDTVATIHDISVDYDLKSLVSLDFGRAFSKLVLSDVHVDWDMDKYSSVVEKLVQNFGGKKDDGKEKSGFSRETVENIWSWIFRIPVEVQMKNTKVHYADSTKDFLANVKMIDIDKHTEAGSMDLELEGEVLATMSALKGKSAGEKFKIHGLLLSGISGSSATVSLSKHNKADYSISDTEFLLRYSDDRFALRTTKQTLPYSLGAEYDISGKDIMANLSTKNLDPFTLVKMPTVTGTLAKFRGMRVSADASVNFNLDSKRYGWSANGSLGLPAGLLPSYERAVFNLSGNNSIVRAHSLSVYGDLADATFVGTMDMNTFMPRGDLSVGHLTLPYNKGVVSGDVYIDSIGKKITCFVPQLYLDDQDFTAVQFDLDMSKKGTMDFAFSISDYSHQEAEQPGVISVDGTIGLGKKITVNAGIEVDRLYGDSIASALSFFLVGDTRESLKNMAPKFSPYIMSTQIYLDTDLKSYNFNCPYVILANTQKDRQMLVFSLDGSKETINISQLELLYDRHSVTATAGIDLLLDQKQIMFNTDFSFNSIPYRLSGIYTFGQWLSITGDYGLELDVNFNNPLHGVFSVNNFPISAYGFLLSLSARTNFTYSALEGFNFNIENLSLEDLDSNHNLGSKISLSGKVDNESVVFDQIGYSDTVSTLTGSGEAFWDINQEGIFKSASVDLDLGNEATDEKISIVGALENPMDLGFDKLVTDWALALDVSVDSFPLGRFLKKQGQENIFTGKIHGDGTLENPKLVFDLEKLSMNLGEKAMDVNGRALFDQGRLDLQNFSAVWDSFNFDKIDGYVDLTDFSGQLSSDITWDMGSSKIKAPLGIGFESEKEKVLPGSDNFYGKIFDIPEEFTVYLDADPLKIDLLKKDLPLHFTLFRSPGLFIVTSDDFLGVSGYIYDTGEMEFYVDKTKPIHFDFNGSIEGSNMDFNIRNLYLDLSNFGFIFNSDKFYLYNGIVTGDLNLSGMFSDPVFHGNMSVNGLDVNSPKFIPQHITARRIPLNLEGSDITVPSSNVVIENNNVALDAYIGLDRWRPSDFIMNLSSGENGRIPFDIDIPFVRVKGEAGCDVSLMYNKDGLDLKGSLMLQNTDVTVIDSLSDLSKKKDKEIEKPKKDPEEKKSGVGLPLSVDLNLLIGQKVNFVVNPILRGMIAPDSSLHFSMDSINSLWSVDGEMSLRGGEVFYLSRNFYLKEGKIYLNENQDSFDPELTLRAETRDRDSAGKNVTISLEVINQKVSNFSPSLTSNPVKSESEIMAMLGQIAAGDSSSITDIVVATGDLLAQTVFTRKIENALRDLLNFDILSLRTAILQNVINQTISGGFNDDSYGIGNFFDNTTVYIGKYFGSDIYVDALMQLNYDKNSDRNDLNTGGGLVFRPELGFEMLSPFGNIRWQYAPDFGALGNTPVSSTSLTLSWRMQF